MQFARNEIQEPASLIGIYSDCSLKIGLRLSLIFTPECYDCALFIIQFQFFQPNEEKKDLVAK